MKKNLIIAVLALFSISSIFAQVSTDPTDEFYDLVERWEIQGIISEQPPLRPYPLQRIEAILSEVIEGENEVEYEEQSNENNIRQHEEIEGEMNNEEYLNEQQNEEYENQDEQVEE